MLLEKYLLKNGISVKLLEDMTGISVNQFLSLNLLEISEWSNIYIDTIASAVDKERNLVVLELKELNKNMLDNTLLGRYNLENRRYIGNKNKLLDWLADLIDQHTEGRSFFDVFAGTGVVSKKMLDSYDEIILNDFLYSNHVIYKAFFDGKNFDFDKLQFLQVEFQRVISNSYVTDDAYFSSNYGDKYFSNNDAIKISKIRTMINENEIINEKEKNILLASLIYSADKVANTVGHYDAFRKSAEIADRFVFELINPLETSTKNIRIFREDSNELVRKISTDVAFIDPPYNSRQYSRFYHLLENIVKWDKPKLEGVAMKPPIENMSDYSRVSAPTVFDDLIQNLSANFIVVTYNNTYNSKSSSSKNKITHDQILTSLNKVGKTKVFEKPFKFFNSGKTELIDHREFVFITEVKNAR